MLGPVLLHVLTHTFIQHLTILWQFHVDEVNDDDTTHVTKA